MKLGISLIIVGLVLAFTASLIHADDEFDRAYSENRVCFVHTDLGPNDLVPVIDTWEWVTGLEPHHMVVNYGTTSGTVSPCVPTACPEGMTLLSGNICAYVNPFAHLPILTEEEIFGEVPVVEEPEDELYYINAMWPTTPEGYSE